MRQETAPLISALDVTQSGTSADITWTTDENASTEVEYGLNTSYIESSGVTDTSPRVTSHTVSLSGLTECSEYFYKVVSVDSLSQERTSTGSFITTGCIGGAAVLSSTAQDISTSGGSVSLVSDGSGAGIAAPAGFYNQTTNFQIKKLHTSSVTSSIGIPGGVLMVADHTYDLKALSDLDTEVTDFTAQLTITIYYSDSDISGIDEGSLKIYQYHNSAWTELSGCSVNAGSNYVSCTTSQFSVFGLFGTQAVSNNNQSSSQASAPSSSNNGPSVCSAAQPGNADLFQINTTNTAAILYVSAGKGADKYQVIYGFNSTDERYSAIINVNSDMWIVPLEIGGLAPNTTYFFKVKPINNCTAGSVTQSIGVKTNRLKNQTSKFYKNSGIVDKVKSNLKSGVSSFSNKPISTQTPVPQTTSSQPQSNKQIQTNNQAPAVNLPSPVQTPSTPNIFERIISTVKGWFR